MKAVKKKQQVLVLGATGMVGRTVFLALQAAFPNQVWGTTRDKSSCSEKMIFFDADTYEKDFINIYKRIDKIDYVINCIGLLKQHKVIKDLIAINSLFPHLLEEFAEKNHFKLIHISTDAVFSPVSGTLTEASQPSPYEYYSYSKFLGETNSKNALTFRSSFIGLDPIHHHGLLEKIMKQKSIEGYTNQLWNGCTTVQFAKLCEETIKKGRFEKLRKLSPIYHFSPLSPITKYQLLKTFMKLVSKKSIVKKNEGEKVRRILITNYFDELSMDLYNSTITQALRELLAFEKKHAKN